jgi:hypothetical protein
MHIGSYSVNVTTPGKYREIYKFGEKSAIFHSGIYLFS